VTIIPRRVGPVTQHLISNPKWCITFALLQTKESFDRDFNNDQNFSQIFAEVNEVIHNGVQLSEEYVQRFQPIFSSDWKFLATVLGNIWLFNYVNILLIIL
jgi:hypothetical protein